MANKADRFFYENLVESADCSCRAADFLANCLKNFKDENIEEMLEKLHAIEHEGDNKKHEMNRALARAFVTPIDREDIALISQNIDEVTDSIEEILQNIYMAGIKTVTPNAIIFADKLVECCNKMKAMLGELSGFKKPEKLHEMIIDLGHSEEECDILYLKAMRAIRKESDNVLEIICWRDIYGCLENTADACEHVGDCVETVVMKNT